MTSVIVAAAIKRAKICRRHIRLIAILALVRWSSISDENKERVSGAVSDIWNYPLAPISLPVRAVHFMTENLVNMAVDIGLGPAKGDPTMEKLVAPVRTWGPVVLDTIALGSISKLNEIGVVSRSTSGSFESIELANPKILDEASVIIDDWGPGMVRGPARQLAENEGVLIDESLGLQSSTAERFKDVRPGVHGDPATKYLWTIDRRGINVALEKTPFPTPRGNIVHTNISSEASIGGEAWFGPNNTVTINAGSGIGDAAGITSEQWDAAVRVWQSRGYTVNPIPFGQR